jgi:hypothetical protein
MNPRFRISVGSEVEYEDLVGELYYDDRIVVVLTQEQGPTALEMQLFGPSDEPAWCFQLGEFEQALGDLKSKMWALRRT